MSERTTRHSADAGTWRRLAVGAVLLQVAVLYWPRPPDIGGGVPGLDLVVHLVVFGAVAYSGRRAGLPAGPLLVALVAHAGLSEVVQEALLARRSGDWRDAVADVAGIVLGLLAAQRADRSPSVDRVRPHQT